MPERAVCDQDVRDLVVGDLDTTYLLEASAGTGKTRVLVDRYVRCVLDPEHGAGDVRKVAAITFTEKAAGELRQRIREAFESLAVGAPVESDEAAVIRDALDALDDAPIHTIHGFAGRLLREFPVEAGVDPAFEQLDGLGSEIERGRLWDEWLSEVAAGHAAGTRTGGVAGAGTGGVAGAGTGRADVGQAGEWLSRLLRAGVSLRAVRDLAIGPRGVFGERYDLDPAGSPPAEPELGSAESQIGEPLEALREFCVAACSDESDNGFCAAMAMVEGCDRLLEEPPGDLDQLAAALYELPLKTAPTAPGGAKGNWDATRGGKPELQERYRATVAGVNGLLDAYAEYLTGLAVAVADAFSRWAGATQLALGRLDFTDLLGCLRDLLAGDLAARRALQRRFRYVLVDEFQDTDPLQAEIVFFLCEREPLATDWRDVVLQPGKLFVVGDPKQSIYRFRRADIALYDEVKARVAGQPSAGAVKAISQNFRTTPSVVAWVNNVFADVFDDDQEEGRQPGYEWVEPYRPASGGAKVAVVLGEPCGSAAGEAEAARRREARAVAALLAEMHGRDAERWSVQDRDAGGGAGGDGEARRRPRWGDVAVLFRATTGLETYEQALREAGVPYRVDGGKAYFARREVDDALLCLRAVDDPSDGPALYGALHSTFFGLSDDELFLFWAEGGQFDLFAEAQPDGHEAVVVALRTLRELHGKVAACEPHELASDLVRLVHASELFAATGPGAAQAIANLEKLVDRARAFAAAGGGNLGAFLAWAAEAGDAAGEQESQVDDEGDVVRLLTIHKAKGLEYPIVVLAGGAQAGRGGGGEPIVDRRERRLAIRLKATMPGVGERALEPQAYAALRGREKVMEASENRRLLYVAATRARDHLVVSCFGALTNKDGSAKGVLLGPIAGALPPPATIAEEYEDGGLLVLPPGEPPAREEPGEEPDAAALLAARGAWLERRKDVLEQARRPARATSPSGLEHVDDEVRAGGPGAPPGRAGALALGSAVHRIMERCDLGDESSVGRVAEVVARELGRPDLVGEAAELAGVCWRSRPVRAAAEVAAALTASDAATADPGAVFRELPVGVLVNDTVVTGAVDLAYRDGEAWVIVDYKTDRGADEETLRERYAPQGAAYATAVEAATGGVVREVCLVAARTEGLVVTVSVDDDVRRLARDEIGAAVAAGRALGRDELGQSS